MIIFHGTSRKNKNKKTNKLLFIIVYLFFAFLNKVKIQFKKIKKFKKGVDKKRQGWYYK